MNPLYDDPVQRPWDMPGMPGDGMPGSPMMPWYNSSENDAPSGGDDGDNGESCEMPGNGDSLIEFGESAMLLGGTAAAAGGVLMAVGSPVGLPVAATGAAVAAAGGVSYAGGHAVNAVEVAVVGVMGGCDAAG